MSATGGDILEISYNHPTLGSGVFYPKSAEDHTLDPGGFRGSDDANMIDGGGAAIRQLNRVRWSVETTIANDVNIQETHDKIKALAASPVEATWTISHISGVSYRGVGAPVGDIQPNLNAGTLDIKISGGGELKKI